MAVSSKFNPATGLLTATGDNLDNTITVSRDAAGAILINDGAVPVVGGTPNVANTSQIQLSGRGGHDVITADSSSTVPVTIDGGAGDDTITGGGGADILYAGAGICASTMRSSCPTWSRPATPAPAESRQSRPRCGRGPSTPRHTCSTGRPRWPAMAPSPTRPRSFRRSASQPRQP